MALKPLTVNSLSISVEKIALLSSETRYTYYLLGHIFNELMFLQKLLNISMPKHEDKRAFRWNAEWSQSMFIIRLAAGKLWEAKLAIDKKEVSQSLRSEFLPHMEEGEKKRKDLNKQVQTMSWLSKLRDWHSFHYPTYGQWTPLTEPKEDWVPDEVFLTKEHGNTFYAASEAVSSQWMFGQVNSNDPQAGVEPMINDLIKLIMQFNNFIADAISAFAAERLGLSAVMQKTAGSVQAPDFFEMSLPFWMRMQSSQAD